MRQTIPSQNIYEELHDEAWECSQRAVQVLSVLQQGNIARWCHGKMIEPADTTRHKPVLMYSLKGMLCT